MKYQIPKAIEELIPYEPISGDYKIRLDANESYRNLQPEQLKLLQEKLSEVNFNRYPDPYARKLCRAFGEYYGVDENLVTVFDGSDEALALMSATLYEKGQKLGVFTHDFSMYRQYAETYKTECVMIPKEEDLTIDVDKTLRFIAENGISALLFSNPCNPTSLGLERAEVIRLIEGTDALIILDEAYMDFWSESLLDRVEEYDNLIILKTCSKAVGLAAIRLGFVVANPKFTRVLRAVKSPYNVNTVSQLFGEVILSQKDYLTAVCDEIVENRKSLEREIRALANTCPVLEEPYPSCTNFVYFKTAQTEEIFRRLLAASIAVRKMGDYLRISTGSEEENKVLLRELAGILRELSGGDGQV